MPICRLRQTKRSTFGRYCPSPETLALPPPGTGWHLHGCCHYCDCSGDAIGGPDAAHLLHCCRPDQLRAKTGGQSAAQSGQDVPGLGPGAAPTGTGRGRGRPARVQHAHQQGRSLPALHRWGTRGCRSRVAGRLAAAHRTPAVLAEVSRALWCQRVLGCLSPVPAGPAASSPPTTATLDYLTHCLEPSAHGMPRCDVFPLMPCMGWSAERVAERLTDVEEVVAAAEHAGDCHALVDLINESRQRAGLPSVSLTLTAGHQEAGDAASGEPPQQPDGGGSVGGSRGGSADGQLPQQQQQQGDGMGGAGGPPVPRSRVIGDWPSPVLQFSKVAVGGTFDRLHAGHRLLLAATALVATRSIFVGITGGPGGDGGRPGAVHAGTCPSVLHAACSIRLLPTQAVPCLTLCTRTHPCPLSGRSRRAAGHEEEPGAAGGVCGAGGGGGGIHAGGQPGGHRGGGAPHQPQGVVGGWQGLWRCLLPRSQPAAVRRREWRLAQKSGARQAYCAVWRAWGAGAAAVRCGPRV